MKNKNKGLIIAAIVGIVAIGSAATYFGGGELFQGYYRMNLKPTVTRTPSVNIVNLDFSATCSPSKNTITVGENVTWKTTVAGTKSGDTLEYTWGRATGDEAMTGLLGDQLSKSQFTTRYNEPGTYIVDVKVKRTEAAPAGGWAPAAETVQTTCSVEVKRPTIVVPTLRNSAIEDATEEDFTISCSGIKNLSTPDKTLVVWKSETLGTKDNDTFTYTWSGDTGDVNTVNAVNLQQPTLETHYKEAGNYTVNLTVEKTEPFSGAGWAPAEGENVETAQATCSINIVPPPTPVCTVDKTDIEEGESATFSVKINNAEIPNIGYTWTDPGRLITGGPDGPSKTIEFPTVGSYTISTQVLDSNTLTDYGTVNCPTVNVSYRSIELTTIPDDSTTHSVDSSSSSDDSTTHSVELTTTPSNPTIYPSLITK